MEKSTSIDENCIRLLHIEADETNGRQLSGSIKIVNLKTVPQFTALSYVWGTYSSPVDHINCDGHDLKITSNCFSALWHLRKIVGTLDIWVDAICIDQEDENDKLRQIPLMGEIYAKANPVYLWLGDGSETSYKVMDYLEVAGFQKWLSPSDRLQSSISDWRLASLSFIRKSRFWNRGVPSTMVQEPILSTLVHENRISSNQLWYFLQTDWMNRIWTLQEAVLASNPVICCGERLLPWRSLIISIVYLEYINRNHAFSTPGNVRQKWRSLIGLWLSLHQEAVDIDTFKQTAYAKDLLDHDYVNDYVCRLRGIGKYYTACIVLLSTVVLLFLIALLIAAIFFRIRLSKVNAGLDFLSIFLIIWMSLMLAMALYLAFRGILAQTGRDGKRFSSVHSAILTELFLRNTSEPRDKYLGLYSVLQQLGADLKIPKKSMSQSETYRELFLGLVKWGAGLDLMLCASMSEDENIPSWIPNFDADLRANSGYYRSLVPKAILDDKPPHQATSIIPLQHRQTLIECFQLRSRHCISVYGRQVDIINWHYENLNKDEETQAKNLCKFLCKLLELKKVAPSRTQHRALRTISRPRSVYKVEMKYVDSTGSDMGPSSYEEKTRLYHMGHKDDRLGPWTKSLWNATHFTPQAIRQEFLNEIDKRQPPFMEQLLSTYCVTARMNLFVTDNGLMGAGPEAIAVNDIVFLVRGVSMPLILRPLDDCYRLVGYAEIEGMMNKQFWPDDNIHHMEKLTII